MRSGWVLVTIVTSALARQISADNSSIEILTLLIDSSGRLLAGTSHGLFRYDGESFKHLTADLGEVRVTALAGSDDGSLWVGTDAGFFESRDDEFRSIGSVDHVNSLFVDQEQNVWIAGQGLFRYDRQPESLLDSSGSKLSNTRKLLRTRSGELWVGTTKRVLHFKNNVVRQHT